MYQVPVRGLEKIRRTRKKVKNVLSEFGLEECLNLCQSLQEFDPGDSVFGATQWTDFSDGFHGKWKKKWPYRTRGLCCSLCKFSTRSWYSFRAHINRYHDDEQAACSLSACASCSFIGQPKIISKHHRLFHFENKKPDSDTVIPLSTKALSGHTFQCRKCTFRDDLLYSMRKHVLMNHYTILLNRFAGQRADCDLLGPGQMYRKFYCKVCGANADTFEHLLYHILTSDKHRELDLHINTLIFETDSKKPPPSLAPKMQGSPVLAGPPSQPLLTPIPAPGTVLPVLANGGPRLLPPTSTAVLPVQASALLQLASAEAKGLLQPGQPLTIQTVQAPRMVSAALPNVGGMTPAPTLQSVIPRQQPVRVGVPSPVPLPRQLLLPPGVRINLPAVRGSSPQQMVVAPRFPLNQPTPRGTMLTSQSLLSHLIPTGNKVDGLPTYTLAPLQVLSVQGNNVQVVNKAPLPVPQNNGIHQRNSQDLKQTKKWVTCPICNELFPSNIYDSHVEIHKVTSKNSKLGLAARAPFLKKMPEKTIKCLMCKVLLSEKGIFEHLIHGLNCLFCPGIFYNIKQLVAHIQVEHNPTQKANCDFMRREYRLYTDESGHLLFPYFDINTAAPKEMIGEKELNLALVTNSLDLIFLKMLPMTPQAVCKPPVPKPDNLECVFCSEKLLNMECYQMHLREKHFIVPTFHAILKMPAYKCIFCGGVYTGKTTVKAISVHVSRCGAAPKTLKDSEKINAGLNMGQDLISFPASQKRSAATAPVSHETDLEMQSKLRLELAVKEAIDANKREREARLARRKRLEKERFAGLPTSATAVLEYPDVQFALDPTGIELRSFEGRREFMNKYFNKQPYPFKNEIVALSSRLLLNKCDVASQFGSKRTRCMKHMQRNKAAVLLGFNMIELSKVKHNLFIPEIEPEKPPTEPEAQEINLNTNEGENPEECLAPYEG